MDSNPRLLQNTSVPIHPHPVGQVRVSDIGNPMTTRRDKHIIIISIYTMKQHKL